MALASDVLTRVRDTLLDPGGTGYRWTDPELLRYLSDGQREVCSLFPEAHTTTSKVEFTGAEVRIDLRNLVPLAPVAILGISHAEDEVNGRMGYALDTVEPELLAALDPAWLGYRPPSAGANVPATAGRYYKAAAFDPKDPLAFWLYPRAHQDFAIYVTYTATPAEVGNLADTLALSDQYIPVLHDYVCYRALAKDSLYTGAPAKAKEFQDGFIQKLSLATGKRLVLSPTAAATGASA